MAQRVKIVQTPQGPAPEWVRDAWIGLYLPLAPGYPDRVVTNVLPGFSNAHGWWGILLYYWYRFLGKLERWEGYLVLSARAVEILMVARPDAARWWHENTPELLKPGQIFVFDHQACEEENE